MHGGWTPIGSCLWRFVRTIALERIRTVWYCDIGLGLSFFNVMSLSFSASWQQGTQKKDVIRFLEWLKTLHGKQTRPFRTIWCVSSTIVQWITALLLLWKWVHTIGRIFSVTISQYPPTLDYHSTTCLWSHLQPPVWYKFAIPHRPNSRLLLYLNEICMCLQFSRWLTRTCRTTQSRSLFWIYLLCPPHKRATDEAICLKIYWRDPFQETAIFKSPTLGVGPTSDHFSA